MTERPQLVGADEESYHFEVHGHRVVIPRAEAKSADLPPPYDRALPLTRARYLASLPRHASETTLR